jgi:tRNA(Ile)-lysidine synthase
MPESGVEPAVAAALGASGTPVVLAVSGGADSMVLLHSAARVAPGRVAAIATFDHCTGPAARSAVELVAHVGARLGFAVMVGASPAAERTEAAWRAARWGFLRRVARERRAVVATGHTRDDQVETVVMRALRGAGARGLAGLDVDSSDVVRPLLGVARADVRAYGDAHRLDWIEDPSNVSGAFLRNRVRRELLPAFQSLQPDFSSAMLAIGAEAGRWRREVERVVAECCPVARTADGMSVAVADLARYDLATVAVIWPVIAARAGVTLDRRGTSRLAAFTFKSRVGGTIQLSGGVEVARTRFLFVIRPLVATRPRW